VHFQIVDKIITHSFDFDEESEEWDAPVDEEIKLVMGSAAWYSNKCIARATLVTTTDMDAFSRYMNTCRTYASSCPSLETLEANRIAVISYKKGQDIRRMNLENLTEFSTDGYVTQTVFETTQLFVMRMLNFKGLFDDRIDALEFQIQSDTDSRLYKKFLKEEPAKSSGRTNLMTMIGWIINKVLKLSGPQVLLSTILICGVLSLLATRIPIMALSALIRSLGLRLLSLGSLYTVLRSPNIIQSIHKLPELMSTLLSAIGSFAQF